MRDLKKDLALCEKATPGPWECLLGEWGCYAECENESGCNAQKEASCPYYHQMYPANVPEALTVEDGDYWGYSDADAEFIAASREGWPEAIGRAIRAEGILRAILELTEQGRAVEFTEDWGGNTLTIHIDDAHSHVGVPDGSFDDLLESLYQLLVKGCGLSFVRFVKEGKP